MKHKKAKCRLCWTLTNVCQTAGSKSTVHKNTGTKASKPTQKRGSVQVLEDNSTRDSSSETTSIVFFK